MLIGNPIQTQLAILGGTPVRTARFAPWPAMDEDQIEAATSVLRSGRLNYWTGREGRLFEEEFAQATECKYAVAVANGSVALELALHAIGIRPGDEVIVPSKSFIASASCVVMCGAIPVFADIDRNSQDITAENISRVLSPRTKAIIVVHLAGWPCEMDPILTVARAHGLRVIEDCAQAHGATYHGRPVGSLGDVAAFSFCQDKIVTTCGEGGMLTTNDRHTWEIAWSYKDHGRQIESLSDSRPQLGFRWIHDRCGTNWRMTEVQSAVGRSQLPKVPAMLARRQHHASILTRGLSHVTALRLPRPAPDISHACYKFYAFIRPDCLRPGWTHTKILEAINAEGIPCQTGSCSEIYMENAFDRFRPPDRLPVARELGETSLMFLVHPTLRDQDMRDTCEAVEKVIACASSC